MTFPHHDEESEVRPMTTSTKVILGILLLAVLGALGGWFLTRESVTRRYLESKGYTDPVDLGSSEHLCGDGRDVHRVFSARRDGKNVGGVVCCNDVGTDCEILEGAR